MAAGLTMNCTVSFSGALTQLTKCTVTKDGERVTHSAGVDSYLTFQAVVKQDRRVTATSDCPGGMLGLTPGAAASTLECVLKGAGGGSDLTIGGSAMLLKCDGGADHASVSHGASAEWGLVSADGTTDPLSVT